VPLVCGAKLARSARPDHTTGFLLFSSKFWRFPMQLKWTAVALAALTLVACGKKEEAAAPAATPAPTAAAPHPQHLLPMHWS
jgi:hypothetical protein